MRLEQLTVHSVSSNASATSVLLSPPSSPMMQAKPRWFNRWSRYECYRTILRSMLCSIMMIIAACVFDVGLLISLFGAVGSSMLAIILPPLMYLGLRKRAVPWPSCVFHGLIIAFGVIGMVAGTVHAVKDIITVFQTRA